LNTGNWSTSPHADLGELVASPGSRSALLAAIESRGLELFALNANGNQLDPADGPRQSKVLHDTITLAAELGVSTVVCMSGLPEGADGDVTPNWITSSWPPEVHETLRWQWDERLLPYWRDLVAHAEAAGVERLAIELHGNQLVYNVPTLLRLRDEVGPLAGANLDPSHLLWMGGDPLVAIAGLGDAIHHVHAKDTMIDADNAATRTRLENLPMDRVHDRAWSYVTVGFGQDESWWRSFCYRLRLAGYDGWLSIEHEDMVISRTEGVRRSVDVLRSVAPGDPSDYGTQDV
jgi:sugar phosphate isomerase/epimerase